MRLRKGDNASLSRIREMLGLGVDIDIEVTRDGVEFRLEDDDSFKLSYDTMSDVVDYIRGLRHCGVGVLRDRVVDGLTPEEANRFISSLSSKMGYNDRALTLEYLDNGNITL